MGKPKKQAQAVASPRPPITKKIKDLKLHEVFVSQMAFEIGLGQRLVPGQKYGVTRVNDREMQFTEILESYRSPRKGNRGLTSPNTLTAFLRPKEKWLEAEVTVTVYAIQQELEFPSRKAS